ncbi:MAG: winged helix-turn-helix domain-containing protein [Nitrososphaerales archaeon]
MDKSSVNKGILMSSKRKRGTLSITESILQALKDGPELKTHIAYESRMDSRTTEKYLRFLTSLRLIKETNSGKFTITKKGLELLKEYAKLKKYDAVVTSD